MILDSRVESRLFPGSLKWSFWGLGDPCDVSNKRSKHIDVRYHMVREYVKSGFFTLTHVSTVINRADIMTKALDRFKHEGHTSALLRDYSNKS